MRLARQDPAPRVSRSQRFRLRAPFVPALALLLASCGDDPVALEDSTAPIPVPGAALAEATGGPVWDGEAGNGLWSTPLNWSGDVLPSATDGISIPAGSGTVHLDMDAVIQNSLTMGSGAVLEVDGGATLTLEGEMSNPYPGTALVNHGTITGTLAGTYTGDFSNESDGVIRGIWLSALATPVNHGTIEDARLYLRTAGGTFENFGTITNSTLRIGASYTTEYPKLVNQAGARIVGGTLDTGREGAGVTPETGDLENHGTITDPAMLIFHRFVNTGTVDVGNAGSLRLNCDVLRWVFGTFESTGTLVGDLTADCAAWDGGGDGTSWSDPLNWNTDRPAVTDADGRIPGVSFGAVYIPPNGVSAVTVHLDVDLAFGVSGTVRLRGQDPLTTTLIVDPGHTLSFSRETSFLVVGRNGVLVNEGTLLLQDMLLDGRSGVGGRLENHGDVTLADETFVYRQAAYLNHATTTNQGPVILDGTWENTGTLVNSGSVEVQCTGSYTELGTVTGNPVSFLCSIWDGEATDGLWSSRANWSGDRLPAPLAEVQIPAGSGTVHLDMDAVIQNSLTMGSGAVLEVDGGATLTLEGEMSNPYPGTALVNHGTITGTLAGTYTGDFSNESDGVIRGIWLSALATPVNHGTIEDARLYLRTAGGTFENFGTITNSTLRIGASYTTEYPKLVNQAGARIVGGTLDTGREGAGVTPETGDLENHGTITDPAMLIFHRFVNTGTVDVGNAGSLRLNCDVLRWVFGTFESTGTLVGDLTADCAAWDGGGDGTSWSDPLNWNTDRPAVTDADGRIPGVSFGAVYIPPNGVSAVTVHLDVDLAFGVSGTVRLRGQDPLTTTLIVDPGHTLSFSRETSFLVVGRNGVLVNEGTLLLQDMLLDGRSGVGGRLENHGDVTLADETFVYRQAAYLNHATTTNDGTIDNEGTIFSACDATFVEGTIIGSGVEYETCSSPPVADAGGPYSGDEGSRITFDGTGSYDPDGGSLTYSWDFGDGSPEGSQAESSHTYTDDGVYIVTLTVTDDEGESSVEVSSTTTVENVAPVIAGVTVPAEPQPVGQPVTASADFTDAGTADTHTATIDWGDGYVTAASVSEVEGAGTASGSHPYTAPGVYQVVFTVADDDGGTTSYIHQFVVAFDPNGGFVTGGGWIDSPTGALVADPGLTGKASFGFVSRYRRGATAPEGNTQFQFKAGDLNLDSTSYDFLVVSQGGTAAQFKGSGTINGAPAPNGELYRFMIWAKDGAIDMFRVRIWWERFDEELLVYDNGFDQPIGGGSVVVHTR